MKKTTEQSFHITDKINTICEQIFKVAEQGLAFCFCCKEFISLHDQVEKEFIKHFLNDTSSKHKEFTKSYFKNQKSESKTHLLVNDENLYLRDVTQEIKQDMFLQIKDRQAFCKWCNKTINVPGSIGEEFMLHFNDKLHEQFFTNLIKGEKNLNRKELYKHLKQINSGKKYMAQRVPKVNGKVKGQQYITLLNADFVKKLKEKNLRMQLNSFLQMSQRYFDQFTSELIKIESHFEAFCFMLAITGKKDIEICESKFESLTEEIKILSSNEVLNQQLLKILQECFKILWEKIGFTRKGYLVEQPFQVHKLIELLNIAKNQLIITSNDEDYKNFLMNVSIEELNNLSKNLKQRQQFSDQNKQIKTREKQIDEETNKDKN